MEIESLREQMKINNIMASSNIKFKYEKELSQLKNDFHFLENNLLLEKQALMKKFEVYLNTKY